MQRFRNILFVATPDSNNDAALERAATLAENNQARLTVIEVLEAMPPHSKVIVYGGLSKEPAQAAPGHLIFQNKSIEGFWLTTWLERKNFLKSLSIWRHVQKLLSTDLASKIQKQYPLNDVQKAIKEYQSQMTGGKFILKP